MEKMGGSIVSAISHPALTAAMGGYSKTYSPNFGTSLSSLLLKSGGGAEEAGEPFQPVTLFILPHC